MIVALWLIAAPCLPGGVFPGDDWLDDGGARAASRAEAVAALEDYAFTRTGKPKDREGIRTEAVLVVQGGRIVYERYADGHDRSMRHISWSVAKSITSALTGASVLSGQVTLDDSLCMHVSTEWGQDCDITVRHLLEFSSGIAWQEVYENQSNQASSVLAMLYGEGREDRTAFVAGHRQDTPPGEHFQYSTGTVTLLAGLLQKPMKEALGEEWPWEILFDPIGMRETTMERDRVGAFNGGAHVWSTPRDFARFGYLYLRDGCWDGRRVLPEDWVYRSTEVSDVYAAGADLEREAPGPTQGWLWWLNRQPPLAHAERAWPDVPVDAFSAIGHWGQTVTVIPTLDMVIVRTGDDRDAMAFDLNEFLKLAIAVGRQAVGQP